jgi:hypothetical protein
LPISSETFGVGSFPEPFYDLKYDAFRRRLFADPFLVRASGEPFKKLSMPTSCYKIDFRKDTLSPGKTFVPFQITTAGQLDGFLGWFEAKLCDGVMISNSPTLPLTSWWQLYFPTLERLGVQPGSTIVLELEPNVVNEEVEWQYAVRSLNF